MKRNKTDNEEDISTEDGKIIPFRLLEGGRLATSYHEPPDSVWLNDLPRGTIFLAGDRQSADYDLIQFEIDKKTSKTVVLTMEVNKQIITRVVIPVRFCQKHFLHEIVGIIGYEE